ncbi:His-Xaa-Ser repeat protein HxsA [Rhizobium leguminosarum]|uniref:His-Xaa-Ser repeat protein HxsA n=1 Tax=Rhizobium leguminosarum TaxID=384 RepID=UPI001AE3E5B8|nr:His-Xaa-Ser repeat protein HxsA [Rhizobium leguminosarum]MBP2449605.1 His-Xaa-Ser repeat protein HxsA [Rhizobium leguminosarum]
MKKRRVYLVPSLIAAGFMPSKSDAAPLVGPTKQNPATTLFERLQVKQVYTLAGHSSHSSHASHASHASGSGGGYVWPRGGGDNSTTYTQPDPTPRYSPNPGPVIRSLPTTPNIPAATSTDSYPTQVAPQSNSVNTAPMPLKTLPGNSDKFRRIVIQVQTALVAFGYYGGPLTGQVDAATRAGLNKMQDAYGLKVTGTITPQVLTAFGISTN